MMKILLICLALLFNNVAAQSLQRYNIQPGSITVSGISSGAAMATQYHFAHSSKVVGAGLVAGVPFCCGIGGWGAADTCMRFPAQVNVNFLISEAIALQNNDYIDQLSNVAGHRVFIWQGSRDTTVYPGSGPNVQNFYNYFGANVRTQFTYAAEHGFPTDNYGAACGSSSANTQYFNNCNYKGAFEILNWLYGEALQRPTGGEGNINNLKEYDQREFFTFAPSLSSMDTIGFVYVPTACENGAACKFHIAFHGCAQSRTTPHDGGIIGNGFPVNSGYIDVAEKNNIVVLFPQIMATGANLAGCWDWFGYLNTYFPTKDGNQILATYRMMQRVTG